MNKLSEKFIRLLQVNKTKPCERCSFNHNTSQGDLTHTWPDVCRQIIRYIRLNYMDFICTNSMTGKCDLNSHFGQQSIRGKKLFNMFFRFTDGINIGTLLEENSKTPMKLKTQP